MTCIVGLRFDGKVYIGADSCASNGWASRPVITPKVFRTGSFLIGYTTSFRMGQLLQYHLKVEPQDESVTDDEYLVVTFIETVRQLFKEKGYSKVENNQEEGGLFLVGYRDNLYSVNENFQLLETAEGYDAVGSGFLLALGSLATSPVKWKPRLRVQKALQVASQFSGSVLSPFTVEKL